MSAEFLAALRSRFPQAADRASADHPAVNVPLAAVAAVLKFLRDEQAFDLLMDVTAIDWAEGANPRFTVVYHLLSTTRAGSYIRVAAACGGTDEAPSAPSVTSLWPGAKWHERACFERFGIRVVGHPELRR
ncbi:MAG: NADH-quinone oxidoreductase subunit C, partial [Opitutaceae bacterium]